MLLLRSGQTINELLDKIKTEEDSRNKRGWGLRRMDVRGAAVRQGTRATSDPAKVRAATPAGVRVKLAGITPSAPATDIVSPAAS